MPDTFEFDNAIAVHKYWLRHLELFIRGIEFDASEMSEVGNSRHCALGKWLGACAEQLSTLTGFTRLTEVHEVFHATAAEILRLVRNGQAAAAEYLLTGRLAELSAEMLRLLEALKRESQARAKKSP